MSVYVCVCERESVCVCMMVCVSVLRDALGSHGLNEYADGRSHCLKCL